MATKRVLSSVLSHSIRSSYSKAFTSTTIVRTSINVNKRALATPITINNNFTRYYNTQAPSSDIFKVVDFNDIQSIIKKDAKEYELIDVREVKEAVQGAIPTANNIPLSQFADAWNLSDNEFKSQFGFEKPKKESQIVLYCLGGVRSTRAAEHLSTLGYKNLYNYIGSWADYAEKIKQK